MGRGNEPREVFPAYAGMSPTGDHLDTDAVRFPRLRGDEPSNGGTDGDGSVFSPPTRG